MTQPTKTKGGRGGARAGAGGPPKLTPMQRWAIGARFDRLRDDLAQHQAASQIAILTEDVREEHASLNEVPVAFRRAWKIGQPPPQGHRIREKYEDVRGEIKELRTRLHLETTESDEGVMLSAPVGRPQGQRQKLLGEVAREFGVTTRMVESCLKEFRKRFRQQLV